MCFVAPCGLQTVSGGSKVAVHAMYDAPEVTCGILTDALDLHKIDPLARTIYLELQPSLPNYLLSVRRKWPAPVESRHVTRLLPAMISFKSCTSCRSTACRPKARTRCMPPMIAGHSHMVFMHGGRLHGL